MATIVSIREMIRLQNKLKQGLMDRLENFKLQNPVVLLANITEKDIELFPLKNKMLEIEADLEACKATIESLKEVQYLGGFKTLIDLAKKGSQPLSLFDSETKN